jgi:hypothetical protein
MRFLVIAAVALAGAVAGCGTGAGPATPSFNPFGNEPSGASVESSGTSNEAPPQSGSGQQTLAQLCATDCAHISAVCPDAAGVNCSSSCAGEEAMYPACFAQLQAFFECYSTASLTCNGSDVEATECTAAANAVESCVDPASSVTAG